MNKPNKTYEKYNNSDNSDNDDNNRSVRLWIWYSRTTESQNSTSNSVVMPSLNMGWVYIQYLSLLNWRYYRFGCGSGKLIFVVISPCFVIFKNVVYIVWSLVRRRVTRRLTWLQTMCNVLKYCKIFKNGSVRLRSGCGYFLNFLKTSTVLLCNFD